MLPYHKTNPKEEQPNQTKPNWRSSRKKAHNKRTDPTAQGRVAQLRSTQKENLRLDDRRTHHPDQGNSWHPAQPKEDRSCTHCQEATPKPAYKREKPTHTDPTAKVDTRKMASQKSKERTGKGKAITHTSRKGENPNPHTRKPPNSTKKREGGQQLPYSQVQEAMPAPEQLLKGQTRNQPCITLHKKLLQQRYAQCQPKRPK